MRRGQAVPACQRSQIPPASCAERYSSPPRKLAISRGSLCTCGKTSPQNYTLTHTADSVDYFSVIYPSAAPSKCLKANAVVSFFRFYCEFYGGEPDWHVHR